MQTDNELRKKALVDELGGLPGAGGLQAPAGMPPPIEGPNADPLGPASPEPMAAPRQQDFGRTMGYDAGKFNDPNKRDFKYDTGRILSQFDPRQGFTPDVLAELNKLDYGTFSAGRDPSRLSLTGAKNAKDAGDFTDQDWVFAHKANNDATKWNYGGGAVADAEAARGGGGPAPMFAGSTISPMLQGNAQNNIANAMQGIGAQADDSMLQELIKALGGA